MDIVRQEHVSNHKFKKAKEELGLGMLMKNQSHCIWI